MGLEIVNVVLAFLIFFVYLFERIFYFKLKKCKKIEGFKSSIPSLKREKIEKIFHVDIFKFFKNIMKDVLVFALIMFFIIILKNEIYQRVFYSLCIFLSLIKVYKTVKYMEYFSGVYTLIGLIIPFFIFHLFNYNEKRYIVFIVLLIFEIILFAFIKYNKIIINYSKINTKNIIKNMKNKKIQPVNIFENLYENIADVSLSCIDSESTGEIDPPIKNDAIFIVVEGAALIYAGGKQFRVDENEAVCFIGEEVKFIKSVGNVNLKIIEVELI